MGSRNYWPLLLLVPLLTFGTPSQEEACLKGDGEVCESLGYLYEAGINRPKNLKKAFYFYSKGCEAGNSGACVAEGLMLLKGRGVKKDVEKGKKLLQDYCIQAKSGEGCGALGEELVKEGEVEKGAEFLRYGCSMDSGRSCYQLGKLHYTGIFRDGFGEWESYFMEGCQLLYFPSCRALIFNRDASPEMKEKGVRFIRQLCQSGVGKGCTLLGEYMLSSGVLQEGLTLIEMGCKYGDGEGCLKLGYYYLHGEFAPKNREKALQFFVEGCKNQNLEACREAVKLNPKVKRELYRFWLERRDQPVAKPFLQLLGK